MTFLALLTLALLIVGLVAVVSVRRIEDELRLIRAEHPVPFTASDLAKQKLEAEKAATTVVQREAERAQKWEGKTPQSPVEVANYQLDLLSVNQDTKTHNREVRRYSMMIRANGGVRFGRELSSDAYLAVFKDYEQHRASDWDEYATAYRECMEVISKERPPDSPAGG